MSTDYKNTDALSESHTVIVKLNQVITPDFAGAGVNLIPGGLMENNLSKGYNKAYWEMDRKRIVMMKPKLTRVWFQNDWMESSKGVYTWSSDKMLAFYQYMDALKAAGTEVEFNFGWKVGRSIQSWFGIPGIEGRVSAPNDLEAYAASCSACLNELIIVRGYDNIKFLTFYNEANGYWDFECHGDQKAYYASMVQKVHDKLVADGRRAWVKIFGPEESGALDWFKYMKDNIDHCLDGYSFHLYGASYEDLLIQCSERINYVSPKPVYLTEFGWARESESSWHAGYANSIIGGANAGLGGLAVWQYNGVWCEDPDEGTNTNGDYTLYDSLYTDINPKLQYYLVSMLERYIPAHSSVVATATTAEDIRAAAFKTKDGDITIVVECKSSAVKNLTVYFDGINLHKTFGKHIYCGDSVEKDGNALIPIRKQAFLAETSFTDCSIPSDYCVILYTTLPEQTQVDVTPVTANVAKGEIFRLNAGIAGNTDGVEWSIAYGGGTVDSKGIFTAPADAAYGDMTAVKATSTSDPTSYGIALLTVSSSNSEKTS